MSYPCPFHTLFGFRLRLTERRLWPEQEGRKRGPLFLLPMVELAVMASRFGECDRDGGCTQCSPLSSRSLVLGAMPPFTHEDSRVPLQLPSRTSLVVLGEYKHLVLANLGKLLDDPTKISHL